MRLISSNTWFLEIIQGLTVTESLQQGVLHPVEFRLDEVKTVALESLRIMDKLAEHIVYDLVIPKLDKDKKMNQVKRDRNGFPIITGGRAEAEETTVGAVMKELGLDATA